jgi:hypothetical protein
VSSLFLPANLLLYANKVAQTIAAGSEDLTWNVPIEQNGISQVTPVQIQLLANHTYEMKAYFILNSPNATYFAFWSSTANAPVGAVNAPAIGVDQNANNYAIAIFRPAVDTIVKVRVLTGIGTTFEAESLISIVALN